MQLRQADVDEEATSMIQTLLPQFEAVIDREWNNVDGSVKKSIPAYVTISKKTFKKSRACRDKKHVSDSVSKHANQDTISERRSSLKPKSNSTSAKI